MSIRDSITMDENPEGINQYSGGASGHGNKPAYSTLSKQGQKANTLSKNAVFASHKAAASNEKSNTTVSNHHAAAASHRVAAAAHTRAAKEGGINQGHHEGLAEKHSAKAAWHDKQ